MSKGTFLNKGQKRLSTLFFFIIFLNVFFALNKTYSFDYSDENPNVQYYPGYGPTIEKASGLDRGQYDQYIKALEPEVRRLVITNTTVKYFNFFPRWVIGLIYFSYFLWFVAVIRFAINAEKHE